MPLNTRSRTIIFGSAISNNAPPRFLVRPAQQSRLDFSQRYSVGAAFFRIDADLILLTMRLSLRLRIPAMVFCSSYFKEQSCMDRVVARSCGRSSVDERVLVDPNQPPLQSGPRAEREAAGRVGAPARDTQERAERAQYRSVVFENNRQSCSLKKRVTTNRYGAGYGSNRRG